MLNAAIPATLIRVKCPHCSLVQIRARLPAVERYECRQCQGTFDAEQGRARELAEAYLAGRKDI